MKRNEIKENIHEEDQEVNEEEGKIIVYKMK